MISCVEDEERSILEACTFMLRAMHDLVRICLLEIGRCVADSLQEVFIRRIARARGSLDETRLPVYEKVE